MPRENSTTAHRIGPSRRTVMRGALGLGLAATATAGAGVLPLPRAAAADELRNGGFEQVADGWPTDWEPFDAGSRERISAAQDQVHSGDRSVRIEDESSSATGIRSAQLPITAGSEAEGMTHTVTGNFTIRGVTKSVTFPAKVAVTAGEVHASTEFGIDRKDFGIVYPGKADDLIKDNVLLQVDFVAPRASKATAQDTP